MIEVPREILWDYSEAPCDLVWRLQRIADFFPLCGRSRETVEELYAHRDMLKIDAATKLLIEAYKHAWEARRDDADR